MEATSRHRSVAGVGRVKRRGTPIPVLPPRIPSPMPPPDARVNHHPETAPTVLSNSQRKALAADMAKKLLEDEEDPMKTWINPRLYSKINHDAVKSAGDFNQCRYYQQQQPPPDAYCNIVVSSPEFNNNTDSEVAPLQPQRALRSFHATANRNVSSQQNCAEETSCTVRALKPAHHAVDTPLTSMQQDNNVKLHHGGGAGRTRKTTMDSDNRDSGNESGGNVKRRTASKYRYGMVVIDSTDVNKWLNKHEVITGPKPIHGEVFIDGPLSNLKIKDDQIMKSDKLVVDEQHQQIVHKQKRNSLSMDAVENGVRSSSDIVRNKHLRNNVVIGGQGINEQQRNYRFDNIGAGFSGRPTPLLQGQRDPVLTESQFHYSVSGSVGTPAQASAAAAFFARAAQKLNLSSSPHRRKRTIGSEEDALPSSGFCGIIHRSPPPVPPALLRRIGVKEVTGVGKVKVMLRVAGEAPSGGEDVTSFFSVDKRRKQVTLFDPAACGGSAAAPEDRRVGVAAPKMFAFDAIFTQEDSQTEICSTALTDVIHAVINGTDGCLFCFGHARLGKSHTMLGSPDSTNNLGVIPCAITWLFRGINEQKQKTGARFSVRVSAVEVAGPSQHLKDLLSGHANDSEQSPAVYLRDDPLFGTQLQNHSELRVPSADKAAFYLDAALSSRGTKEESHLLYTLHVYQYSVAGKGGVAGGRSRLHLIDLGSCERGKASGGLPLSGLGNVLLAIFNGQKHLPHREHKLTQLLKECLSSLTCHAAMIAHVSPYAQNYTDTLTTIQLASRIHRMRRRKIKFVGASSGPVAGEDVSRVTGSSDVDPSSSEQSADTVIYVGPSEETDGEHPPVYLPSLNSGDNRCAMGKALRGSGAEQKPTTHSKVPLSKSVPASPQRLAEDCQRMNGISQEERSSPHRSVGSKSSQQIKSSGLNSSKSSPIRTVSKSKDQTKQLPTLNGATPAEEQWIDGPRIPRSKVVEARNLHMLNKDGQHLLAKKETWVDGPLKVNNGIGYGFMDYHKKSMIKKWVENQTLQMQHRHKVNSNSAKEKQQQQQQQPPHYREMTVFKTCDDEVRESTIDGGRGKANGQEDEDDEEVPVVAPLPQLTVIARNGDISRVVPIERLQGGVGEECEEEEEEEMEVEIIEVEEPEEPVPMQDSCLQVTEEDIALCMGEIENPLPEVDQEEHPLRILSQENLTVVSTFTDSLSVVNDLERLFPRTPSFCNRPSSWLPTKEIANDVLGNKERSRFEQLSRLHELYRSKVAVACSSKRLNSGLSVERARPVSRCQSLSLSDMLIQGGDPQNSMDFDNSSIASEPAYLTGEGNKSGKFCDNCRMSLNGRDDTAAAAFWFRHDNSRFHNFRFLTGSISSLRHPDGASNPNLQAEAEKLEEREPGNGAEREKIPGRGDDEEEELTVPPPLHSNLLTLSREGFDCGKGKHTDSSGYASISHRNSESGNHSQSSINGHPHIKESNNSAASVLQYCRADVERLERGWTEAQRNSRLRELKREQRQLKAELAAAKSRLLIPAGRWSYELHVEDSWQDWTDSHSFLEALRQETLILRKRVEACKSHVLIATCFDCRPQYPP